MDVQYQNQPNAVVDSSEGKTCHWERLLQTNTCNAFVRLRLFTSLSIGRGFIRAYTASTRRGCITTHTASTRRGRIRVYTSSARRGRIHFATAAPEIVHSFL
ncbi:hypothetical protein PoB_001795500 [Plakobranchus ocellatus]|uniref:Uncharacterized protein n=1 Tax=Plakobranchus ocellatus TaxID=259542 RepID=A0AAV3ZA84_9GAST|nr:hypothetical protein PoB_001795500 [Plakobranchus ocellatus]